MRKDLLFLLLLSGLISIGCSKDSQSMNSTSSSASLSTISVGSGKGMISGVISPARAATVTLSGWGTASPDSVSGKFAFTGLMEGPYSVFFSPDSSHDAPTAVIISLATGGSVDLGTIVIPRRLHKKLTLSFDDRAFDLSSNAAVAFDPSKITVAGIIPSGDPTGGTSPAGRFTLIVDRVNIPGTYPIRGTATSTITFARQLLPYYQAVADSGVVTFSLIDTSARTITGSFSSTMSATGVATRSQIKNGVFEFRY